MNTLFNIPIKSFGHKIQTLSEHNRIIFCLTFFIFCKTKIHSIISEHEVGFTITYWYRLYAFLWYCSKENNNNENLFY